MKGYKFNSQEEREEAEKWRAEHERELPKESDGSRINGDPILYVGGLNELAKISDRHRSHVDDAEELDARQAREMEQRAMLVQAIDSGVLTDRQKEVIGLILDGRGVREIAQIVGIDPSNVVRARDLAVERIREHIERTATRPV